MEAMSHHAQYEGVSRRITTERKKYVFWKDDDMWLGYLDEYPDYMTQGKTLEELKENLIDIFNELNKHIIQRQIMAASTLIPLLIRRECL
ncbi:MAG: type II toxin-antitoxin system HicB family antitoxin, partial [Dissulfuribacterales bacterium]